jgi:1-deoxy-D-xylulose 5-phosphate reductoisomerase
LSLHVVFDQLPPSANKIYFRGTVLTAKARKYAEDFAKHMAQHHLHEIVLLDKDAVYAFHMHFYFDTLVNATWGDEKLPPSKRAKSRYKRIDLDNRIKLITDCVRDAIAIDDCQVFAASQEKHMDPTHERVEIFVQEVRPQDFGL